MPVSTDTFRNMRRLHLLFAGSALLLLFATLWLVVADYQRMWRGYQQSGRRWETAMTQDAQSRAVTAQQQRRVRELDERIAEIAVKLDDQPLDMLGGMSLAEAERRLTETETELGKLGLPAARVKGEIGPVTQQLERAVLAEGEDSELVDRLRTRLAGLVDEHRAKAAVLAGLEKQAAELAAGIKAGRAKLVELEREQTDLLRERDSLGEKLAKLDPSGLAKLSELFRNAPLLDWFNPSEKVPPPIIAPDIRSDLNFLTVDTLDLCHTCHVNIDNPAFEEGNLLAFVERQVASYEGQDVDSIDRPVVMLDFWVGAAEVIGGVVHTRVDGIEADVLGKLNRLRKDAGQEPVRDGADLVKLFKRAATASGDHPGLYDLAMDYLEGVQAVLKEGLGDEEFELLRDQYRLVLTEQYNGFRAKEGLAELSTSPVLLGHPDVGLYVHPDSAHPMTTMGCTSCHEGSGQETQFEHAAHMPRDMWVDAETGVPVPSFLIEAGADGGGDETKAADSGTARRSAVAGLGALIGPNEAVASVAAAGMEGHGDGGQGGAVYIHEDLNLADPDDPAPFAPKYDTHGSVVTYSRPTASGDDRRAVRQADYWADAYGWHAVHFMHWEKPMHSLEYVESSCNKCHTEVFDLKDSAPKLYEGRLLFSQMGCVNCHAVTSLEDDLDIKKVGPDLRNVGRKLSPQMMASWIWAPKAFRPTTKMPHYFMLENNSSPVDILRTRTEVTAMTYYLTQAASGEESARYEPEAAPEESGDVVAGRALFNDIGCLSCHSNLEEHGDHWIAEDLVARGVTGEAGARERVGAMDYNQKHVYALEHLGNKLERTGPELSGVGTKLRAGRSEQEAKGWLYDWLRNPRHYSSYTIMPSFRLTEQEANDLTAYLLSLERPGYEAADFGFAEGGQINLDAESAEMLTSLVATLKSAQSTPDDAMNTAKAMPVQEKLDFLGKKMIAHYGCNGCHEIGGFAGAASACTNLDDWGLKDPHKLDFGYFDHAFDQARTKPAPVWKVAHEGLDADAPSVTSGHEKVGRLDVHWEHMEGLERRPWLYHKLHNPRVYDRGRTAFDGEIGEGGEFTADGSNVGRPYDKLKMPKFFLSDQQVRSLMTYVTSIRRPLVSESIQRAAADEAKMRVIRGRQVATLYNCYGCHNIEGTDPQIWEFFDVHHPNGSFNYENLNNAPPRLVGQGAKTQPDWMFYFLNNVHELRPWLKVRMPSFPLDDVHSAGLVDYFAGASQVESRRLMGWLDTISEYRADRSEDLDWFTRSNVAGAVEGLKGFALSVDLVRPGQLDRGTAMPERRAAWEKVVFEARFLADLFDVDYPFDGTPRPDPEPVRFARGEALFNELRCHQCHALGDEDKLLEIWKLDNPHAGEADDSYDDEGDGYDDVYGEDEGYDDYGDDEGYGDEEEVAAPVGPVYTAPNLSYSASRLQWKWLDAWLQEPATIQPGTKMPQWFAGGDSAFAKYPAQVKGQVESMYGYSGADQRELLLDFVYAAGLRNYTRGGERLTGVEAPEIVLEPLPAPAVDVAGASSGAEPGAAVQSTTGQEPGDGAAEAADQGAAEASVGGDGAAPEQQAEIEGFHDEPVAAHDGGGRGRVIGAVQFAGKPPRRKPVRMGADPFCDKEHRGKRVLNESMVVGPDGAIANVFIYVKSGPAGFDDGGSGRAAVLDQRGCLYVPHVIGVVAGQPLKILNSDNTLHNVKMNSQENGSFNEGMPVRGMELDKVVSKPELGIQLKCDVHPWMGGVVHVVEHRYFSVTDGQGRFEIADLKPGRYTLEVVHESKRLEPVTVEIEVGADQSHRTDVTLGGS